ncbi:MAG: hypothetical protein ACYC6C_13560, partial [Coriobacteriia bacterium]
YRDSSQDRTVQRQETTVADAMTCHFVTPSRTCGAPAEFHLLVDDEHTSRACGRHLSRALSVLQPIDYHEQGEFCWLTTAMEPRLRWRMTSPPREGFCYIEHDERFTIVETRELVSSSPISETGDAS